MKCIEPSCLNTAEDNGNYCKFHELKGTPDVERHDNTPDLMREINRIVDQFNRKERIDDEDGLG